MRVLDQMLSINLIEYSELCWIFEWKNIKNCQRLTKFCISLTVLTGISQAKSLHT